MTGIILAGGQSRRMGQDKAVLPLNGQPLIVHAVSTLRRLCQEVLVVTDDARRFLGLPARVVEDMMPGAHAMGGLYTGLRYAAQEVCFVAACDMPYLNPALVQFLRGQLAAYDLVIPRTQHGWQPLHAVYRRTCLPAIARCLNAQRWDVQAIISDVRSQVIDSATIHRYDPDERSFWNLNTPAEYAAARA